jgi:hypothetical protein
MQQQAQQQQQEASWMNEFALIDSAFIKFDAEANKDVKLVIMYVNNKNQLESIKTTLTTLNHNNELTREAIVDLIATYTTNANKTYVLKDILKYHVTLDNLKSIKTLLKHEDLMNEFVLRGWNYSTDVSWPRSINFFKKLNSFVLLFKEKPRKKNPQNVSKKFITKPSSKRGQTKRMQIFELN